MSEECDTSMPSGGVSKFKSDGMGQVSTYIQQPLGKVGRETEYQQPGSTTPVWVTLVYMGATVVLTSSLHEPHNTPPIPPT